VAAIGCIAAIFILIATNDGLILSHDSVAYIAVVRSLLEGHGLVIPYGYAHPIPLTHWPPLYPLVLALFSAVTGTVTGAARWLTVILFVLNTVMVGSLARKYGGSAAAGYAAACLFAFSREMWQLHDMLMAEPLFFLLILLFVYFLDEYLLTGKFALLLVSATLVGLSQVTRYAGLPFVAWGAIVVFVARRNPMRARVEAIVWALVAIAPMVLLTAWKRFQPYKVPEPALSWHMPPPEFWTQFLVGTGNAFVPEGLPGRRWVMTAVCVLFVPFCVGYLWRNSGFSEIRTKYLVALITFNAAFLLGVGLFVYANLDVQRAAAPISILLIILVSSCGARLLRRPAIVAAVCAAILVPKLPSLYWWVDESARHGEGLIGPSVVRSETIAYIRQLPPGLVIYTNLPEPVYMLTGRNARFVPFAASPNTGAPLSARETESQLDEIKQQVRLGSVVAVYFSNDPVRLPWMITGPALAAHCGFTRVIEFEDATIYLAGLSNVGRELSAQLAAAGPPAVRLRGYKGQMPI
jgi:hypothetical protein